MTPRRRTKSTCIALLAAGFAAVAACSPTDVATLAGNQTKAGNSPAPTGSVKPSSTGVDGTVEGVKGSPSPSPDAGASPTPAPSPTPRPSPTPSPTAIPYTGFAVEVVVSPATASINLKDPENPSSALYPVKVTLSADVLMSDNSHTSDVTWSSSDEQVATVSVSGVVTSGTKKGTATITATSADGQASGTSTITVEDKSALDVTIN